LPAYKIHSGVWLIYFVLRTREKKGRFYKEKRGKEKRRKKTREEGERKKKRWKKRKERGKISKGKYAATLLVIRGSSGQFVQSQSCKLRSLPASPLAPPAYVFVVTALSATVA
jgi:hypothetical protein